MSIREQLAEAIALHRAGELPAAATIYRQLLAADPQLADAWHLLGLISHQTGDHTQAIEQIERAIALKSTDPAYYCNLGCVLNTLDRNHDALVAFEQALELREAQPKAWFNLGNALKALGRKDEALNAYHRALAFQPGYAEAHTNIGVILRERGELAAAVEHYRAAVAARPDFAQGLFNLGNAIQALSVASPNEQLALYEQAVRLQPDYFEAHTNLGVKLKEVGRLDEAVAAYQAALRVNPEFVEALSNLSVAYQDLGLLDEARGALERAMTLKPRYAEIHSNYVFIANYAPDFTPEQLRELHVRWAREQVSDVVRRSVSPRNIDPERRLRVGFMSPDLHVHPVGRFIAAWFDHHDRTQFETYVYADVERADDWTTFLRKNSAVWRDVRQLKHEPLVEQIIADEIDVLVDLAGHTSHNRLPVFAARPAPVQLTYLGYPNTTGLDTFDGLITDAIADPPGYESHYSERLVRLDPCFSCFYPPSSSPEVNELPAGNSGSITYGGLHNLAKLNSGVLDLWAELMRREPNSRLLLFRASLCGTVRARLLAEFVARGIEQSRIDLRYQAPEGGHSAVYREIDIALDVFPWSGHTTACEALWMGVPVVTLATDRHAGRMVASVLHSLGRDEWIATSPEQYLHIAQRLAADRTQLAELRRGLRAEFRASPQCDTVGFTRRLEAVFRSAWRERVERL